MAIAWVTFAAQKSDAMLLRPFENARHRPPETRFTCHGAVQRVALGVVVLRARWPAPEIPSEEEVPDRVASQCYLKVLAVEVGRVPRVGVRPHVDDELDALLVEQANEAAEAMIRVPDGP